MKFMLLGVFAMEGGGLIVFKVRFLRLCSVGRGLLLGVMRFVVLIGIMNEEGGFLFPYPSFKFFKIGKRKQYPKNKQKKNKEEYDAYLVQFSRCTGSAFSRFFLLCRALVKV